MEVELFHYADKAKYWNNMDEGYGLLCLFISKDLLFHITGLKNLKEIWDQLFTPMGGLLILVSLLYARFELLLMHSNP